MKIPIYQLDAFTEALFSGNPAAVCPLEGWLSDDLMQAIAAENNLSETAFLVAEGGGYGLRWFTPTVEVDLCGHATLAAAHLLLNHLGHGGDGVAFETRSGTLAVKRDGGALAMDFPALPPGERIEAAPGFAAALGGRPAELYKIREVHGAPYLLALFGSAAEVARLAPNFAALGANVIATAPGGEADFVSRFFAPVSGIDEDPVTGSAHCTLTPFWAERLGKSSLKARQISARGGEMLPPGRRPGDRLGPRRALSDGRDRGPGGGLR